MLLSFLTRLGRRGNSNLTILTVGTIGVIGITGAGVAVTQYIRRSMDEAMSQEEALKVDLAMGALRTKFIYDSTTQLREWKVIDCGSGKKCVVQENQTAFNPSSSLTDLTGKITIAASQAGEQRITVSVPAPEKMNESQADTFFNNPSSAPPQEVFNGTGYGVNNSQVTFTIDSARDPANGQPGELVVQALVPKRDGSLAAGVLGSVELKAPNPPICNISAARNSTTNTCTVTVNSTGVTSGSPTVEGITLNLTGVAWTNSNAPCSQIAPTSFRASVVGPGGGGTCDSLPVPPVPPASCTLAVTRTAPGALTCYISLTADYSLTTSASTSVPSATLSKSSNNLWIANNVACLATAFSGQASVIGPGGAGTCQSAQVPAVAAPACTLASASRVGNTSSCSVQVTTSGGPASSVSLTSPLAVTLSGSGTSWSSSNINCSQTSSSTFSARVTGPGGTVNCSNSLVVGPVTAPSCISLTVTRTTPSASTCNISLVADYSLTTSASTSIPSATLSKLSNNLWSANNVACPATAFNGQASVTGPGGAGTCQSAQVPAVSAPSCTLTASRNGNTGTCSVSLTPSGNTNQNPSITSPASYTLSQSGTSWINSNVTCDLNTSTTFTGRVTGPGGSNTCPSPSVGPVAPTCTLTASRNPPKEITTVNGIPVSVWQDSPIAYQYSDTCTVTLNPGGGYSSAQISGPYGTKPGSGVITWTDARCWPNQDTSFDGTVTGPAQTINCTRVTVPKIAAPTCTLTARRNTDGSSCNLSVQTLGIVSSPLTWAPDFLSSSDGVNFYRNVYPVGTAGNTTWRNYWRGANQPTSTYTNDVTCSGSQNIKFRAYVSGPGGTSPPCDSQTVGAVPPPSCRITASRNSDLVSCTVTVSTSGTLHSPATAPALSSTSIGSGFYHVNPSNPYWSGASYISTASCLGTQNVTFRATVSGPGGTSSPCDSLPVAATPAPTCTIQATRQPSNPNVCDVAVTGASGTVTGASVSPAVSLTPSGYVWRGVASCPSAETRSFTGYVSGPGSAGSVACSVPATVNPVPPQCITMKAESTSGPNCSIEVGLGNNLSTKPNVIIGGVNASSSGSWNGNTWRTASYNCGGTPNQLNISLQGAGGALGRCPCWMVGSIGKSGLNLAAGYNNRTIENALTLPNDATEISAEIYQIHADDNNPQAWINNFEVYDINHSTDLKLYRNYNVQPRYQVGHRFKAGVNSAKVQAYNRYYKWTSWFSLSGSYRANSCNAVFQGL